MSPIFMGAAMAGARSAYKTSGRMKSAPPSRKNIQTTWEVEGQDVCTLQHGLPSAIRQGKIDVGYDKKLVAKFVQKEEINPQQELKDKGNLEIGAGTGLAIASVLVGLACPPAGIAMGVVSAGVAGKGIHDKMKAKDAPRFGYKESVTQQAYVTLNKNEQTGENELLYSRFEVDGKVDHNSRNPTVLAILE